MTREEIMILIKLALLGSVLTYLFQLIFIY